MYWQKSRRDFENEKIYDQQRQNSYHSSASITKARKVEYIDITPPVKFVLDSIDEKLKGNYQKYRFVDWLSLQELTQKRLHEDKYVRSDQCRIKKLEDVGEPWSVRLE